MFPSSARSIRSRCYQFGGSQYYQCSCRAASAGAECAELAHSPVGRPTRRSLASEHQQVGSRRPSYGSPWLCARLQSARGFSAIASPQARANETSRPRAPEAEFETQNNGQRSVANRLAEPPARILRAHPAGRQSTPEHVIDHGRAEELRRNQSQRLAKKIPKRSIASIRPERLPIREASARALESDAERSPIELDQDRKRKTRNGDT